MEQAFAPVIDKLQEWLDQLLLMLPNLLVAILIVTAFWLVSKLARRGARKLIDHVSDNRSLNQLFGHVVAISVIAVGLFIALGVLQLDKTVTSLLAGAGVIGLALGFALQSIASNFLAGTILSIRKPFAVGELVETNGYLGTVERIDLRTTALRTPQGQLVLVPNKEVFENAIINYTRHGARRVDLECGVSYGDDLDEAERVAIEAVSKIDARDRDKDVELFYKEFGGSSINFVVRIWLKGTSQKDMHVARSAAIKAIKTAFDEADLSIPFPIRTIDFGIRGGESLAGQLEGIQAADEEVAAA